MGLKMPVTSRGVGVSTPNSVGQTSLTTYANTFALSRKWKVQLCVCLLLSVNNDSQMRQVQQPLPSPLPEEKEKTRFCKTRWSQSQQVTSHLAPQRQIRAPLAPENIPRPSQHRDSLPCEATLSKADVP